MRCFVPSCNNTLGVPFPEDIKKREKWLEYLNLNHLIVEEDSFLCIEHFNQYNILKEEYYSPTSKPSSSSFNETIKISETCLKMCRICMCQSNIIKNISEPLETTQIPIMTVIMQCCQPIKISIVDDLPQEICQTCLNDLKVVYKFRTRCLDSSKKLEKDKAIKRKLDQEQKVKVEMINKKVKLLESEHEDLSEFIKLKPSTSEFKLVEISNASRKKTLIGQKIIVPKKCLERFASPIGEFSCEREMDMFGHDYVTADNYLYVNGLKKNNVRSLHCLLESCEGLAEHKVLPNGDYDNNITVKTPHNHPSSSEEDQDKQLFFHMIRRQIQINKTLNVKSLYEEIGSMKPFFTELIPLRDVINEICKNPVQIIQSEISSFESFYNEIENRKYAKLHFTQGGDQFYQERIALADGSIAIVFANQVMLRELSHSEIMYVDASFKIETDDAFKYQLVTTLLWVEETYYPVMFTFINKKSQAIFQKIFQFLHNDLAPNLRPKEIITDFEASLYYALAETYYQSQIGGSIFYYTQNLYKKVCSLNLARDLETNSYFRSIYHMLLMLPLLPVNTIGDAFLNIEAQAKESGVEDLLKPILSHIQEEWFNKVTPNLFCVHRLENRINEIVIAPFKKLRDFLLVTKGKIYKRQMTLQHIIERLIELESFLNAAYVDKKLFGRDLSSTQKKNVLRAWIYIESHPKININNFFAKVQGFIKCMENQLWIWGFYRYKGGIEESLIDASNFSIANTENENLEDETYNERDVETLPDGSMMIMEGILDQSGKVVIETRRNEFNEYLSGSKVLF